MDISTENYAGACIRCLYEPNTEHKPDADIHQSSKLIIPYRLNAYVSRNSFKKVKAPLLLALSKALNRLEN